MGQNEYLMADFDDCRIAEETSYQARSTDFSEEVQLSFLNRKPKCSPPLLPLELSEKHTVLFLPLHGLNGAPKPYPDDYRDKWDENHVRMPCSPLSKYPVKNSDGKVEMGSRWDLICRTLKGPNILSTEDLKNAIMQYNAQYKARPDFSNLHGLLDIVYTEEERTHFFHELLPSMITMALDLPNICTQPPPLLKQNYDHYITISQKQIGCLLLNAFFCTFPRRNIPTNTSQKWSLEYFNYPDINFHRLFYNLSPYNIEKLKCLINYFKRIISKEPTGTVTFHRQYLQHFPNWQNSKKSIRTVVLQSDGLIEDEGRGMLQVDFANKFVGGGVLGLGCVQEEIRFVICPELIVSRLFVESLGPSEVLIITGAERFNNYDGYSENFKWTGSHEDDTSSDTWGRKYCEIVAMDATFFTNTAEQFNLTCIARELNKAYCGFYENDLPSNLSAVATGNWGCGAFHGNPSLKFTIQLMAASEAGRDLLYLTHKNKALKKELKTMENYFVENSLEVGDLYKILTNYCKNAIVSGNKLEPTLHDFICSLFSKECAESHVDVKKQPQSIINGDKNVNLQH